MMETEKIPGFSPSIYHSGPPLSEGVLPALFYFALAGDVSLNQEPFNQPVTLLKEQRLRIFSMTLPGHGPGLDNHHALPLWLKQLHAGHNIVNSFVQQCIEAIDFLIQQGYIDERQIAAAGLSRGAFMAAQLGAADDRIKTILGYAPLTRLDTVAEFKTLGHHPLIEELALINNVERLIHKKVHFFIGNRDILVETDACYAFIRALTEAAYTHHHRSPPIELTIYPSIGHKGHGTPPEIFRAGTEWLKEKLYQEKLS